MTAVVQGPRLWFMSNAERPSEVVSKSAQRLRVTRVILGLEQTEMATACGVSSQRWSNWENEAHLPDVLVMTRAVTLYGFTLDWIYRGAVDRMPHEFVTEIQRRRPDLILGAEAVAQPSADWDQLHHGLGKRSRRGASRAA